MENGKIIPAEPPKKTEVGIFINADKEKNVVRIQFAQPIQWVEFDPIACANMMRHLGEKLKELSQ